MQAALPARSEATWPMLLPSAAGTAAQIGEHGRVEIKRCARHDA